MKPSPTEYVLLKVLWSSGRASAREIHDSTVDELEWSFSSTRKTLDRMVAKKLIAVSELHGIKVYAPAVGKVKTIAGIMKEFAARVLEIDGSLPVTAFSDSKILDESELAELQALLEDEKGDGE